MTDGLMWHLQYVPLALLESLFGKGLILILTSTVLPRNDAVHYLLPNICCHVDIGMIHFYISSYFLRDITKPLFAPRILVRNGYLTSPLVTLSQNLVIADFEISPEIIQGWCWKLVILPSDKKLENSRLVTFKSFKYFLKSE